jgi:hypothetical protein
MERPLVLMMMSRRLLVVKVPTKPSQLCECLKKTNCKCQCLVKSAMTMKVTYTWIICKVMLSMLATSTSSRANALAKPTSCLTCAMVETQLSLSELPTKPTRNSHQNGTQSSRMPISYCYRWKFRNRLTWKLPNAPSNRTRLSFLTSVVRMSWLTKRFCNMLTTFRPMRQSYGKYLGRIIRIRALSNRI